MSLKTGSCPEDCHFCSQSGQFTSPVRSVWLDIPELVKAAQADGRDRCERVLHRRRGPRPGRAADDADARRREGDAGGRRHQRRRLPRHADRASRSADLVDMGVHRYNHNLETARSFFPSTLVSTHTWEERFDTCTLIRGGERHGVVCGGLVGIGERSRSVRARRAVGPLEPAEVPLDFLNPRPGTPFGDRKPMEPATPSARSRRSGSPCRARSCATPAAASSLSVTSAPVTACSAASTPSSSAATTSPPSGATLARTLRCSTSSRCRSRPSTRRSERRVGGSGAR